MDDRSDSFPCCVGPVRLDLADRLPPLRPAPRPNRLALRPARLGGGVSRRADRGSPPATDPDTRRDRRLRAYLPVQRRRQRACAERVARAQGHDQAPPAPRVLRGLLPGDRDRGEAERGPSVPQLLAWPGGAVWHRDARRVPVSLQPVLRPVRAVVPIRPIPCRTGLFQRTGRRDRTRGHPRPGRGGPGRWRRCWRWPSHWP